jgi:hypothetical protein
MILVFCRGFFPKILIYQAILVGTRRTGARTADRYGSPTIDRCPASPQARLQLRLQP